MYDVFGDLIRMNNMFCISLTSGHNFVGTRLTRCQIAEGYVFRFCKRTQHYFGVDPFECGANCDHCKLLIRTPPERF